MEKFFPSEIARLVLGYLKEVKCTASWQTFLNESSDLREYNHLCKEGEIYPTDVNGKSLRGILTDYCALKSNRDCSEANSLQEVNFLKAGSGPSHHECETYGASTNVEKYNLEIKKSDDTKKVGIIKNLDLSQLELLLRLPKNVENSDSRHEVTEVAPHSLLDSNSINFKISSNPPKSAEITYNICTKNSVENVGDNIEIDVPDDVPPSFSKDCNEMTSCTIKIEKIDFDSTDYNIYASENEHELSSNVRNIDSAELISSSNTVGVDTEIEKNGAEKKVSTSYTENVKTENGDDTLSKFLPLGNITDSCSNHMPSTQMQHETVPIFEMPCPTVPTLLVPSFSSGGFPLQNSVQCRVLIPAGYGSEPYLPLPAFQAPDNVSNSGIVISKVSSSAGNLGAGTAETHSESVGNCVSILSNSNSASPSSAVMCSAPQSASTTELNISRVSQRFEHSVHSQTEKFSEYKSTVSRNTSWIMEDTITEASITVTVQKSPDIDSCGEGKDDNKPEKKRKKKERSDKDITHNFWCQICSKRFFSAYNLRRHCRNVHRMDLPKGTSEVPFVNTSQCLPHIQQADTTTSETSSSHLS